VTDTNPPNEVCDIPCQPTVLFNPHVPFLLIVNYTSYTPKEAVNAIENTIHQCLFALPQQVQLHQHVVIRFITYN
jgi:hypothetical protein